MGQPSGKVKILYVITQGEMGGAQRYVFDLANFLDKDRYEILVAAGPEKKDLPDRLAGINVATAVIPSLVRNISPISDIRAIFELKRLYQTCQPDIIHLNSSKAGVLGSLAARLAGMTKVIFTAHGFAFLEPRSILTRGIYYWAERLASKFRGKIITVSDYDRQQAIKANIAPTEKLVTIHNGIEADKSAGYDNSVARPFIGQSIDVGTIANLYKTKGLEYLVDAAKLALKDFPQVRFVVIGEGTERANLESRISNLGLEDNFKLVGEKPNAARYLSQFNIFILPSIKEGFPYTLLEAMAAGLPIVATRVGGIPEAMIDQKTGILVEPKNPPALANAIADLLRHPEKAKALGAAAREQVKKFSLERMVRETETVYSSILND